MRSSVLRFVLVLAVAAAVAAAQGKGKVGGGGRGGGDGGGGGGGGSPAPPDAAIALVDGGLKVMNDDGTNVTTILPVGNGEEIGSPAWSPDNERFAVAGTLAGTYGIHVVQADGSGAALLTPVSTQASPAVDWSPVPVPDGRDKIAYGAYGAGESMKDIWIVNPDGTGVLDLTNTPDAYEARPTFSRDGTKLAYVRDFAELVIANLGVVGGQVAITSEIVVYDTQGYSLVTSLQWARTQDVLVLTEFDISSGNQVMLLDVFRLPGVLVPVTAGSWASFAPDDSRLVFQRGGIFVIDLDGGSETQIAASGYDPRWRR